MELVINILSLSIEIIALAKILKAKHINIMLMSVL